MSATPVLHRQVFEDAPLCLKERTDMRQGSPVDKADVIAGWRAKLKEMGWSAAAGAGEAKSADSSGAAVAEKKSDGKAH